MNKGRFDSIHPTIAFCYFLLVAAVTMFVFHLAVSLLSLLFSSLYYAELKGIKSVGKGGLMLLPIFLAVAVINPLFVSRGDTILLYYGNNPITLEAIIYGIEIGVMIVAVITWFACYNLIISSDKLIYIFGKILPSLSLMISMALRLVPRFTTEAAAISAAQQGVGRNGMGGIKTRVRGGLNVISALTTWALEGSINTADSMKARGYGIKNRTSFSRYRIRGADIALIIVAAAAIIILSAALINGNLFMTSYPRFEINSFTQAAALVYGCTGVLFSLPLIIDLQEAIKWRWSKSKI